VWQSYEYTVCSGWRSLCCVSPRPRVVNIFRHYFGFWQRQQICLFAELPASLWGSLSLLFSAYRRGFAQRTRRGAHHSSRLLPRIRMSGTVPPLSLWLYSLRRDNFTLKSLWSFIVYEQTRDEEREKTRNTTVLFTCKITQDSLVTFIARIHAVSLNGNVI
jgi:hypothetical protein